MIATTKNTMDGMNISLIQMPVSNIGAISSGKSDDWPKRAPP